MKRWFPAVSFALLFAWSVGGVAADLIPADRLTDWTPGVTVGVPGGIPTNRTHLIDVTKAPYNADNTGKEDARKAIEAAIAAAAKDDVVYLPAGTYRGGIYVGARRHLTIRGDGPGKTILTGPIHVGAGGADWWYPNRLKLSVTGSPKRGATELTVGDTKALNELPNGGIGAVCQVSPKNDLTLPVGTPGNFEYLRRQETRIVEKTATTVTISPGLLFDLPESLAPILRPTVLRAESVGIEDLTVDGKDINAQIGVGISAGYACWIKNVHILNINNYHISIPDSLQCEIRQCYIATRKGAGSNGAGILVGTTAFCLIEDNIVREQFPHFEINTSVGNVIAYNFCDDSAIQGHERLFDQHQPRPAQQLQSLRRQRGVAVPERRLSRQLLARHRVPQLVPRHRREGQGVLDLREPEPLHARLQHRRQHPGAQGRTSGTMK